MDPFLNLARRYIDNPLLAIKDGLLTIIAEPDDGPLTPMILRPTKPQLELIQALYLYGWVTVLKARQIGNSTIIAACFFLEALFRPNTKVLVVAHTTEAAESIFRIYQTFYQYLPDAYKIKCKRASTRTLEFVHGSIIHVTTAGSESVRSSTWNRLHLSEVSSWRDFIRFYAACLQSATKNAIVVMETTAKGMNAFHEFWYSDTHGYHKLFFGWLEDPKYVMSEAPSPPPTFFELEQTEGLPDERRNYWIWHFRKKCKGDINIMNQEMPSTPEQAFLTTGSPYLPSYLFPGAPNQDVEEHGFWNLGGPTQGLYSLGIDISSGSAADRTAAVYLNIAKKPYKVTTTYRGLISPTTIKETLQPLLDNRPIVVPEMNAGWGVALLESLQADNYPYIYQAQRPGAVPTPGKLGWYTTEVTRAWLFSRLTSAILQKDLDLVGVDPRLLYELRSLVFSTTGKPTAKAGAHDDLAIALGLALMGTDQASTTFAEEVRYNPPRGIVEKLNWERKHGTLWKTVEDLGMAYDDDPDDDVFSASDYFHH